MIVQQYKADLNTRRIFGMDGRPVSSRVDMFARDELVLGIAVETRAGTTAAAAVDLTGFAFQWGLKKEGELHEEAKLAFSDTDKINVEGDWADADLATGKISVRIALNTVPIAALFATASADVNCVAELSAEKDGAYTTVVQFGVRLRPDVVRQDAPYPEEIIEKIDVAAGWKLVVTADGSIQAESTS